MKPLFVACSVNSSGMVNRVPVTPNQISSGLRPTRSEMAPYFGCRISAKQRATGGHQRRLVVAEANRQFQELLHVRGVRVEAGASHGEPHHHQHLARVAHQRLQRTLAARAPLPRRHEVVGLVQVPPHGDGHQRQHRADEERDPPAPRLQLVGGEEHLLQQHQDDDGAELPADEGDVLGTRIEAAVLLVGDFAQVGGAGAGYSPPRLSPCSSRARPSMTGAATPIDA